MQRSPCLLVLLAALAACDPLTDADGDGIPDYRDEDGNGVPDDGDPDSGGAEGLDSDGDGIPDNQDRDDDNDGTADGDEVDRDSDGIIDDRDSDDDNDGIPDASEADRDGDGVDDDQDPDDDNDGTLDAGEADTDGDGIEDDLDVDDDGDGIPDTNEPDRDGDGLTNDQDLDDDNDGTLDVDEADVDLDGTDDDLDVDDDNDGVPDTAEADTDGDGIIDDRDIDDDNDGTPDAEDDDGVAGGELPPGTPNPSSNESIVRYEPLNDTGGGYVTDVTYDAATDTFSVDNLAFDGDNVYTRDSDVATLSSSESDAVYAVYETSPVEFDGDTPIGQFTYRAIYGVSANTVTVDGEEVPASQFAIVRTGSYVDYGFGGFIYERNGGVELPTTGQAAYEGEYAGIRVFEGRGGLEYTRGDVDIAIDFRDFNAGSGVQGTISNREAFDINGNSIPTGGEGELVLPNLSFEVGPGTVTGDGEMTNGLNSYTEVDGALQLYEEGSYYAIIGGEDAGEIVGVFVVESQDPRFDGVTAQETGGFIVYR